MFAKLTRETKKDAILFAVLYLFYLMGTFFLFRRQVISFEGRYPSDMGSYLAEVKGLDSGYSFPYPIMFWIAKALSLFMPPAWALSITVTGLNGLSVPALKYFMDKRLNVREHEGRRMLSTLAAFSAFLTSMLYPFWYLGRHEEVIYPLRYLGVFTPNPYHNATYLCARSFAIVAFFVYLDVLEQYESKDKWFCVRYLIFSIALLLATMTKPSFTLILVANAGLVMLWRLIRSRFRNWKAFFQLGIWFIPTFLDLLYQYRGVFAPSKPGEVKGIGIGFFVAWAGGLKVWNTGHEFIPGLILLATAFPLTVLLFHLRGLRKEKGLLAGWLFFLVAFASVAFFYEKGPRLYHMNFSWGYMYGLFFLYAVSLMTLLQDTFSKEKKTWMLLIQWVACLSHLVCGVDYVLVFLHGTHFM